MFSLISGFLNWYFAKPTFKLLIIGNEKSGKSVNINYIYILIYIYIIIDIFRTIKIHIHRSCNTIKLYLTNIRFKSYFIFTIIFI